MSVHVSKSLVLSAFAAAALVAQPALAGGIGFWGGQMDTDTFGKGVVGGGQLELDAAPWVSLLVRGGYASGFDDISLSEAGFVPGVNARRVFDTVGVNLSRAQIEDFAVAPVEGGVLLRLPAIFDVIGIYGGAGAGWYFLPGFDIKSGDRKVSVDSVTDMVGFWALGGVDVGISFFHLFAEAKYVSAKKDGETFDLDWVRGDSGAVRADIDLSGLTVLGGVRFEW